MKDATRAVRGGRSPGPDPRFVNPPVYHASTVLFEDLESLKGTAKLRYGDGVSYAVHGTPGTYAFEEALAELEGGHRTRICSAGAQALSGPLLACLAAGDHVLIPDAVYGNTRDFAAGMLARFGVSVEFYDPLIGGGIRALIRPETKVVYTESPGSQTFDVQDIPAIAEEAHKAGALVFMDNTWASPLYFKPFEHGVDVSIQAVTKYIAGHGDLVMGAVTATEAAYPQIQKGWYHLGLSGSPDDTYLALRGLRTIHVRLPRHWESGIALGDWLRARDEVEEVLHPAMPHDPGHAIWKRDFRGAGGLFAFWMAEGLSSAAQISAFCNRLELFGMGFSWGSYQSMLMPVNPRRTASPWPRPGQPKGQLVRVYAGLEDVDDLKADLDAAFAAARAA
ncbi:cystathionine beta-lyase [Paralimibaculum aggregatum]|uniref:Cystathionine beta-lyase n=1 Tax=Paralimibaculum aggregatum TaxID=3036245 RepID=A0ABQ6LJ50_9RHOB|nr:cystathionine beta-lyase [Limibaculum sp. NKW23]GMG83007.1 cystathionine beta-lyase [Limibaculum sp. NKW23]